MKIGPRDLERVLVDGARWMVKNGYGEERDAEFAEAGGALEGADEVGGHIERVVLTPPYGNQLVLGDHLADPVDPQLHALAHLGQRQPCGDQGLEVRVCGGLVHPTSLPRQAAKCAGGR